MCTHMFLLFTMKLLVIYVYCNTKDWIGCLTDQSFHLSLSLSLSCSCRHILKEYTHCIDKARKFSLAVDLHLAGKPCPLTLINKEEVTMCLRWLTHIFYTTKTITTFITVSANV